jgi:O-antigen/teichoic acid export membrane protein
LAELPLSDPSPRTLEPSPPPAPSKGSVKSGAIWIGGCFAVLQIVRFGSSIVLSHWLTPEIFGLVAIAFVFLSGLHLFSDLGIRISIIQNERGDEPAFLDTAWTIQVVRGCLIFLATIALAYPAAFWRPVAAPELLLLFPAIGFSAVIDGFTSTKLHGLYRHLQQRKAVLIDLFSSLSGTAVTLIWAYFDRSARAIVAGTWASVLVQVILSNFLPGRANRLRRDPESTRQLLHFGRWIFLSTLFNFLADQSDRAVVSLIGLAVLGYYNVANQIALIPATLMANVSRQLIMPLYSRLIAGGHDLRQALATAQIRVGAATALLISGVIAVAPTLVVIMYPQAFQEARWIVKGLAIVMMVQIFDVNGSALLFARGKPHLYVLSHFTKVVCLAIFMPLAALGGIFEFVTPPNFNQEMSHLFGLIVAIIIGETGRYTCTGICLYRLGLPIFRRDLCWAAFALTTGFAAAPLIHGLGWVTIVPGKKWPEMYLLFLLQGVFVVLCWCVVVGIGWKLGWFGSANEPAKSEVAVLK